VRDGAGQEPRQEGGPALAGFAVELERGGEPGEQGLEQGRPGGGALHPSARERGADVVAPRLRPLHAVHRRLDSRAGT